MKEQTTRALHGALGPLSDVSVVYIVATEQAVNLTFLVADPAGQLAQVIDVHVNNKTPVSMLEVLEPTYASSNVNVSVVCNRS